MGLNIAMWLHADRWPRDAYELLDVPRLAPRNADLSRRASLVRQQLDAVRRDLDPSAGERGRKLHEYLMTIEGTLRDEARWRQVEQQVIAELVRLAGLRFGSSSTDINAKALVRWLVEEQNVHPSRAGEIVEAIQSSAMASSTSAASTARPPRPPGRPPAVRDSVPRSDRTPARTGQATVEAAPSSFGNAYVALSAAAVVMVVVLAIAVAATVRMMRQDQRPLVARAGGPSRTASASDESSQISPRTPDDSDESNAAPSSGPERPAQNGDAAGDANTAPDLGPRSSSADGETEAGTNPTDSKSNGGQQPNNSPSPQSPPASAPPESSPSPAPRPPDTLPSSTKIFRYGETPLAVAWNRSGAQLAAAGHAGVVVVWDVEKGAELVRLSQHKGTVSALAWSDGGKWLASGGEDAEAVIWNTSTWAVAAKCPIGSSRGIRTLAWLPGDRQIIVGTSEGGIRYFDADSGRLRLESDVLTRAGATVSLGLSNRGSRPAVVSGHVDGTVGLWEVNAKGPTHLVVPFESPLWPKPGSPASEPFGRTSFSPCEGEVFFGVAPSSDGKRFALANGDVEVWRIDGALVVRENVLPGRNDQHERDGYRCVAWSVGDGLFAAGYCEGDLDIWDTRSWRLTHSFKLPQPACCVAWSPSAKPHVAVATEGQDVLIIPVDPAQTSPTAPRVPVADAIRAAEQFHDDQDWPGYCRARSLATMHRLTPAEMTSLDRLRHKASRAALDRIEEIAREGIDANDPAGTMETRQLFEVDPSGDPGRKALELLRRRPPTTNGVPKSPGTRTPSKSPSSPKRRLSP